MKFGWIDPLVGQG